MSTVLLEDEVAVRRVGRFERDASARYAVAGLFSLHLLATCAWGAQPQERSWLAGIGYALGQVI